MSKVAIKEIRVEGRSEVQHDRGMFEKWISHRPTARYWKSNVVKAKDAIPVTNKKGAPVGKFSGSGITARHLVCPPTAGTITLRNFVEDYPVGAASVLHWHNAEEAYYVIEGNGTVVVEDERHNFKKGDGIFIPMRTKHKIINNGKVPLKLLGITSIKLRPCDDLAETSLDYREYREEV